MIHDIRSTIRQCTERARLTHISRLSEMFITHTRPPPPPVDELEQTEQDYIAAARQSMSDKQFQRAAYIVRDCRSDKARYYNLYCQYLSHERLALDEWYRLSGTKEQPTSPVNNEIPVLLEDVAHSTEPWLMFISNPWIWAAWCLLGDCIDSEKEYNDVLARIPLPANHPVVYIPEFFPASLWVMSMKSRGYACLSSVLNSSEYRDAQAQFERILSLEPDRLEDIDFFSDILYVMDNKEKLSFYAQKFQEKDKNRPEVCCFIGNAYSIRTEHENAVKYFRRATYLDRTYYHAWTSMGHEYLVMGNTHAAIEAYRRTLDITKKDYRAWAGMGQAYRVLGMYNYSLYYYERASAVEDPATEDTERIQEAISAYSRALKIGINQSLPGINWKLGSIFRSMDVWPAAEQHFRAVVQIGEGAEGTIALGSLLALSERNIRFAFGNLSEAKEYLERVASSNTELAGRAAVMLKAVKTKMAVQKVKI
ncbi:cell division control protein 23 [Desarmillaria tabescens]|uniref:Cell division control protein 23 n=1 Tax=Armillaria tabescens TaxID=1929756 RepID=A0AA39JLU6_ARMTA|nr:cell division control protein 23 [Desarmillaria tabescens]KAK0444285.1 cell division control protein 23 [Desarmillaria tabescens]